MRMRTLYLLLHVSLTTTADFGNKMTLVKLKDRWIQINVKSLVMTALLVLVPACRCNWWKKLDCQRYFIWWDKCKFHCWLRLWFWQENPITNWTLSCINFNDERVYAKGLTSKNKQKWFEFNGWPRLIMIMKIGWGIYRTPATDTLFSSTQHHLDLYKLNVITSLNPVLGFPPGIVWTDQLYCWRIVISTTTRNEPELKRN